MPAFDPTRPCDELLPATKSHERCSIRWIVSRTTANAGHLTINQGRTSSEYLVAGFPAVGGRGFRFAKVAGASDTTTASEDVFLSDHGYPYASCTCRGFARHSHCKHLEAIKAILENGWLVDATPVCEPPAPKPIRGIDAQIDAEFA